MVDVVWADGLWCARAQLNGRLYMEIGETKDEALRALFESLTSKQTRAVKRMMRHRLERLQRDMVDTIHVLDMLD